MIELKRNVVASELPYSNTHRSLLKDVEILIVDDSTEYLFVLRRFLEHAGARVLQARCLKEARETLERSSPGLVLTDILMPEDDGVEVLKMVRELRPEVSVAALTCRSTLKEQFEIYQAGFDFCLSKSVSPVELLRKIREFI